jgi:hypothetical protein
MKKEVYWVSALEGEGYKIPFPWSCSMKTVEESDCFQEKRGLFDAYVYQMRGEAEESGWEAEVVFGVLFGVDEGEPQAVC